VLSFHNSVVLENGGIMKTTLLMSKLIPLVKSTQADRIVPIHPCWQIDANVGNCLRRGFPPGGDMPEKKATRIALRNNTLNPANASRRASTQHTINPPLPK
jgi:hypothetical protein